MYKVDTIPHYLPTKLIKKIESDLLLNYGRQYDSKNKYLHCIITLHYKQINEYPSKFSYVNVGSDYWKELYYNTYKSKVLDPLLESGILESHGFGRNFEQYDADDRSKKEGQVEIRYRINPDLLNEDLGSIYYLKKGQKLPDKKITQPEQKYFPTQYQRRILRISIDESAANWIDENARRICVGYLHPEFVDALPLDYVIKYHELIEKGSYDKHYHPILVAKNRGVALGKQLFYYKDQYYLADLDIFIDLRTEGIKYQYKTEISRIRNCQLISTRNERTLRLHNHLVNFPSKLLPFLRLNGQKLVQVDLSTSQFLLFASLLNVYLNEGEDHVKNLFKQKGTKGYINRFISKIRNYMTILPSSGITGDEPLTDQQRNHDTLQFINDVFNRDFYSHIGQLLNLPERGLAKITLFQQLFRKKNRTNVFVKILRDNYPTVMNIMDDFKGISGSESVETNSYDADEDNNLSVFLQCVEAEIYIDRILQPLQKLSIPCFSRHDSICTTESYQDQVQEHITKVFKDLGFEYKDKIEDHPIIDYSSVHMKIDAEDNDVYEIDDENDLVIPEYLFEEISEIKIQEDYSDIVHVELLEEFASLSGLTQNQQNSLSDDVANLRSGMSFLQDETNSIITEILIKNKYHENN